MPSISKSKYLAGLQCRKLFWTHYNDKTKIPPYNAATQAIFDQGHEVGHRAKTLFPEGLEIEGDPWDFEGLMARTREAMKKRVPLYEAAFGAKSAFARADILVPVEKDAWDIVEVKSSTEVKPVNIHDLALQRYAAEAAGLKIRNCYLMHIDNTYVRQGEVDAEKLFAREDVTSAVAEGVENVGPNLAELLAVLRQKKVPDVRIGPHCDDPYTCVLHDVCWAFLPENSPLNLTGYRKIDAFELIHRGILRLEDIPDMIAQTEKQAIQIEAARTGRQFVDPYKLRKFLKDLEYPRFYLDFETFQTAIPVFDLVRPYQQIPFQYSLHIVRTPGAAPEHHSYLSDGKVDPRLEFLARLKDNLDDNGSIICYNAAFERGIVEAAVEVVPGYAAWWKAAEKRLVDLLVPFRSFAYYHPDQLGSASLKSVLPALTGGPGYENLEIRDGGMASWEYLRVTFGNAGPDEKARVRKQLEEYCGLDTEGMIRIVSALESL
ncbi:MAG: DUF2779 domain-containing protein [Candidatus Aminicenantes bacterium]|nr:DUF2779 domain-containing protein [Candidatus Aminicenantes bacterium]